MYTKFDHTDVVQQCFVPMCFLLPKRFMNEVNGTQKLYEQMEYAWITFIHASSLCNCYISIMDPKEFKRIIRTSSISKFQPYHTH